MLIKIPLKLISHQVIPWKLFNKILSIQFQGNTPTIWADDSKGQDEVGLNIYIFYTGQTPHPLLHYLATLQHQGLVYHVYSEA